MVSDRLTALACRLRKHKDYIGRVYPEHDRNAESSQGSTFLGGLQPGLAIFGLIASLTIVLVFTTATWWSTPPTFKKIAVAYGAVSTHGSSPQLRLPVELTSDSPSYWRFSSLC